MTVKPAAAPSFEAYGGSAPENYERHFTPAIGAPLAADLIAAGELGAGERVLDVACGTGIVARLAADHVGPRGVVAGLDINPGMLAVARSVTPQGVAIDWHEGSAEILPFAGSEFGAVFCQLGLQFFADKVAALREMRRVVAPGGRVLVSTSGPTPELFGVLAEALAQHVSPEAAQFVHQVFSLDDPARVRGVFRGAGFNKAFVRRDMRTLHLPAPADFLWQYVYSTPLAAAVAPLDSEARSALERDVVSRWRAFTDDGGLTLELGVLVATMR
ncbi:MAG: methyltransferase domain-containing protein [Actinoallomurus sp.]